MKRNKEILFSLIVETPQQLSDCEADNKLQSAMSAHEKHVEMFNEKSKQMLLKQIKNERIFQSESDESK